MTDLERAVERVTAFLREHGSIDDNSSREEICRVNHETLFTVDLRLLVQATAVSEQAYRSWAGTFITSETLAALASEPGAFLRADRITSEEPDALTDAERAVGLTEAELAVLECDETLDCEASLHVAGCSKLFWTSQ